MLGGNEPMDQYRGYDHSKLSYGERLPQNKYATYTVDR